MASSTMTKRAQEQVSNDAQGIIQQNVPYIAEVTLVGSAPLLMHRYSVEAVEQKGAAAKNSIAKKTDNVESYVYRDDDGFLGIAGRCLHSSICEAGRSLPDPRSPRKSMRDLLKAAIQVVTFVAPFQPNKKEWDYLDVQRVVVQRAAVPRTRPAMNSGWRVTFRILVSAPEYITPQLLRELLSRAGRFCGLLDYRPTYGRFTVDGFNVLSLED